MKDKFGVLMEEGVFEYNQRRRSVNVEKKKKKGMLAEKPQRKNEASSETFEQGNDGGDKLGGIFDAEERKRFYKALFEDGGS